MAPSTRLWNRLRDIPSDPNDPECLKEVVIVAFGAFERYYVCWKNQNGEYRQGMSFTIHPICLYAHTHCDITRGSVLNQQQIVTVYHRS